MSESPPEPENVTVYAGLASAQGSSELAPGPDASDEEDEV